MSSIKQSDPRPGIGHNGGPSLTNRWGQHCWRRAHKAAWRTPDRTVAALRLKRAQAAGLDYRRYTSLLMQNGRGPKAVLLHLDGSTTSPGPTAWRALASALMRVTGLVRIGLVDHRVADDMRRALDSCLEHWLTVDRSAPGFAPGSDTGEIILAALSRLGLPPLSVFLVGIGDGDRRLAERIRLAGFFPTETYPYLPKGTSA